ncbi:MAG TPA: response regulator [Polyangiaceae bacterium]|nr:response regulator [Polyangiaceae bacterium]
MSIFTASPYHHAIAVAGVSSLATKALALVVEDEATMRKLLRVTLVSHGFRVVEATSGTDALRTAAAYVPDVILLDLGLSDMDGIAVVKQLREWAAIPVIVVSARSQEQTKVRALDAGADDYLDKPFAVEELMARVRVALKHAIGPAEGAGAQLIHVGDLTIDLSNRLVSVGREEVRLTPTEYKLLALLVQNHGRVLTQGQLLNGVWGPGHDRDAQYLRVYMGQLRRKLERDPAHPRYLLTEAGVGYRFKVPTDSNAAVGPTGPTAELARGGDVRA